jgi:hypothetical protein
MMSRANLRPCLSYRHVEIAKGFAVICPKCARRSISTAQPVPPIPIAHEDAAVGIRSHRAGGEFDSTILGARLFQQRLQSARQPRPARAQGSYRMFSSPNCSTAAFDLLELDGEDLRRMPIETRKSSDGRQDFPAMP